VEEDVIQGAIFAPRRADHHPQAFDRTGLADEVIELGWAK
jgi:hypothetical protein